MDLRVRLENCTERAVLLQIFQDIQNDPKSYENVVEACYESIELFGKFLTPGEFSSKLEPILVCQPPIDSIHAFSKALTAVTTPGEIVHGNPFRDVMILLGWLRIFTEKNMGKVILESLKIDERNGELSQKYFELAISCVHIPDKIANCRATAISENHLKYINTVLWNYKTNLLDGIRKALIESHENMNSGSFFSKKSNIPEPNLNFIAQLVSGGRNMEISPKFHLLTKIIDFFVNLPKFDDTWRLIAQKLFVEQTSHGIQVHESLLTSIFLKVKNETELTRCIDTPKLDGILKRVVLVKLPFQRILPFRTVKLLLDFIQKLKNDESIGLLQTAIRIWSDSNFARKSADDQEMHTTRLILYLIRVNRKTSSIPWSELFLTASNGVFHRMQLSPIHIRSAIFLNEILCKLAGASMDPKEAPPTSTDLENLKGSEWSAEMESILEKGIQEVKYRKTSDSEEEEEQAAPEEDKASDDDDEEEGRVVQLDSDDDEEFPNYAVDETERNFQNLEIGEEPRRRVAPPTYIHDAFEQLLEKENADVFEAAFFQLPTLIKRKAIGFLDIAEQLFIRTIHLQNNFATANFNDTVEQIAVLCIVNCPKIVPALIRLIIAPGQGIVLQQRLLHYIHMASEEMGYVRPNMQQQLINTHNRPDQVLREPSPAPEQPEYAYNSDASVNSEESDDEPPPPPLIPFNPVSRSARNWQRARENRIEQNTRRFANRPAPKPGSVNQLAKNANFMFFPLLVIPRGENARLLNEDSDLLSQIIMIAAMILVRSGKNPKIVKMSTELISYVTPFRFSENLKLRTSCIAAHVNMIATMPWEILVETFPVAIRREWEDWCDIISANGQHETTEYAMAQQFAEALSRIDEFSNN